MDRSVYAENTWIDLYMLNADPFTESAVPLENVDEATLPPAG